MLNRNIIVYLPLPVPELLITPCTSTGVALADVSPVVLEWEGSLKDVDDAVHVEGGGQEAVELDPDDQLGLYLTGKDSNL